MEGDAHSALGTWTWTDSPTYFAVAGPPARGQQPGLAGRRRPVHLRSSHALWVSPVTPPTANTDTGEQPGHPRHTQLARCFLVFVERVQFPDQLPDK